MSTVRGRLPAETPEAVAVLVTGVWLALLMLGVPNGVWLAVMLFGYVALVPLAGMLSEDDSESDSEPAGDQQATETEAEEALGRLRRRYAEGELTDEQFERKLERLLETETLEDVERQFEDETGTENRDVALETDTE